jgi:hypothetical protein
VTQDIRTSVSALRIPGELLMFMQKDPTVIVKDQQVQKAFMDILLALKATGRLV